MPEVTDRAKTASLDHLTRRCAQETERFFRRQPHSDSPCFELFRHALRHHNSRAWDAVVGQYTPLVTGWVREHARFHRCNEAAEHFVNEAFWRLWRGCTPEKFDRFGELAQLLSYLKACVHSSISDHLRRQSAALREPLPDEIDDRPDGRPQQRALDQERRAELERLLASRVHDAKERLVLEAYFMLGLPPREILARHSDAFADVYEVYRVKDNLMRRLRRDDLLRRFLEDDGQDG